MITINHLGTSNSFVSKNLASYIPTYDVGKTFDQGKIFVGFIAECFSTPLVICLMFILDLSQKITKDILTLYHISASRNNYLFISALLENTFHILIVRKFIIRCNFPTTNRVMRSVAIKSAFQLNADMRPQSKRC